MNALCGTRSDTRERSSPLKRISRVPYGRCSLRSVVQVWLLVYAVLFGQSSAQSENAVEGHIPHILCHHGDWYRYYDATASKPISDDPLPNGAVIQAKTLIRIRTGSPEKPALEKPAPEDFLVIGYNPNVVLVKVYCFIHNDCYKPVSLTGFRSEQGSGLFPEPISSMHRVRSPGGLGPKLKEGVAPITKDKDGADFQNIITDNDGDFTDEPTYILARYEHNATSKGNRFSLRPKTTTIGKIKDLKPGLYKIRSVEDPDTSVPIFVCADHCEDTQKRFKEAKSAIEQCGNAIDVDQYLQELIAHLAQSSAGAAP